MHIKLLHAKIKDYECRNCDGAFSQKGILGTIWIRCIYCSSHKPNMCQHIKQVHAKIKDYECEQCILKRELLNNMWNRCIPRQNHMHASNTSKYPRVGQNVGEPPYPGLAKPFATNSNNLTLRDQLCQPWNCFRFYRHNTFVVPSDHVFKFDIQDCSWKNLAQKTSIYIYIYLYIYIYVYIYSNILEILVVTPKILGFFLD